jgi:hypothetical protein
VRLPLAVLVTSAALVTAPLGAVPTASAAPAVRAGTSTIAHTDWDTAAELATGKLKGAVLKKERVVLDAPTGRRSYAGTSYDVGSWTSRWTTPGLELTELIASWSAQTPGNSWIEVKVRGKSADGARSSWDVLGRWTSGDKYLERTSVPQQDDDLARVNVDTWVTASATGLSSYQLQVSLFRKTGAKSKAPSLDAIGAVATRLPMTPSDTSLPGVAGGIVLDVPAYSQMTHEGDFAQWGGGGEAWCSPTSTAMVLGYYDALPVPASYSWVPQRHVDPYVDHAARGTYDHEYDGTGNWPFNTAYAAPLAGHAFVTRLASLQQAEKLIRAGIPVVASISFGAGELTGAPITSTNGHLLVIVGFTATGDVVVNDPAAPTNATVRRTYARGQFEHAWLPTSGGLAYVIRDDAHPLPKGGQGSW